MATYYFSSKNGKDSNAGTSLKRAWRTSAKFNATTFAAGDIIYFVPWKHSSYLGAWETDNNGTSGNTIKLSVLEGAGDNQYPIFSNLNNVGNQRCLLLIGTGYIDVIGLFFRDARTAGIEKFQDCHNVNVQRCKFGNVGIGVRDKGNNIIIEDCDFTELRMSADVGSSSDHGAVPLSIEALAGDSALNVIFRRNRCRHTRVLSDQFSENDGGGIEGFRTSDNVLIYDNVFDGSKAILEFGGSDYTQTLTGWKFYNNICIDCGYLFYFNDPTPLADFAATVSGFQAYHNTIYITDSTDTLIYFGGPQASWTPLSNIMTFENNICYFKQSSGQVMNYDLPGVTHRNNLYITPGGTVSGITLNATPGSVEYCQTSTALFKDPVARDFRLTSSNNARGTGRTVSGYTQDINGAAVNSPADMGALQYKAPSAISDSFRVVAPLAPRTNESNYAVVDSQYVKGGFMTFNTLMEMYALPAGRRRKGMLAATAESLIVWQLQNDLKTWQPFQPYQPTFTPEALLVAETASGAHGGAGTVGSFVQRPLTGFRYDYGGVVADLANNRFTLRPGLYRIEAKAKCNKTNATQLRLYDVTNTAVVVSGMSSWAPTNASNNTEIQLHPTIINPTTYTDYEIQQHIANLQAGEETQTFGRDIGASASNGVSGVTNVFMQVWIQRLG